MAQHCMNFYTPYLSACSVFSADACISLGPAVGGTGGGPFSDPCNQNTKIVLIEIITGNLDGLSCVRYIKTTYRYIYMH